MQPTESLQHSPYLKDGETQVQKGLVIWDVYPRRSRDEIQNPGLCGLRSDLGPGWDQIVTGPRLDFYLIAKRNLRKPF